VGKKKTIGMCRLCGETRELTDEHIPPKSAFNDRYVVMQSVADTPWGLRKRKEFHQGGFKKPVLCAICNNNTGARIGGMNCLLE
jgi:hypothetical protein